MAIRGRVGHEHSGYAPVQFLGNSRNWALGLVKQTREAIFNEREATKPAFAMNSQMIRTYDERDGRKQRSIHP